MASAPPISQAKSIRQNRRWIAGILMAALFLSGGVIGAGLAAIAIHNTRQAYLVDREKLPEWILLMIQNDLGITLSPDQTQEVKAILEKEAGVASQSAPRGTSAFRSRIRLARFAGRGGPGCFATGQVARSLSRETAGVVPLADHPCCRSSEVASVQASRARSRVESRRSLFRWGAVRAADFRSPSNV